MADGVRHLPLDGRRRGQPHVQPLLKRHQIRARLLPNDTQTHRLLQVLGIQHWNPRRPNQRGDTTLGRPLRRRRPQLLLKLHDMARRGPQDPAAQTVGANSHTFTNTGSFVTCVKNFPGNRGVVMGLSTGYISISAAVITQLYRAFYGDDTSYFTQFAAWVPTVLSFAFIGTIRIIKSPVRSRNDDKVFYKFMVLQRMFSFNQTGYGLSAAAVLFLLFLPLVVVFEEEHKLLKTNSLTQFAAPLVVSPHQPPPKETVPWWKDAFKPPEIGEDYTILQALFSVDMLTLLVATISGVGGTATMIDNLGQIGTSFGYPSKKISDFVSLTSIWSYLGQITAGILYEILITEYKYPRPLFLTLIILLSSIGHLLIAFNVPSGLYVASVITGFCSGAIWPLIYTIISEVFGLKYYSTPYYFGGAASPIGLYLLDVRVTGYYYDKEAKKQMAASGAAWKPGEALNCLGGECFRMSFFIIIVVALFGAVVSLVLAVRTTKFYRGDIYKKEVLCLPERVGVGQEENTK
ncbi:Major facilitator superfamily domain containing protein [Trema orientale]|uniref:Major facilitator superfamily domain containing protein n=1 Tax=Trema orientale TaxID=63057 RepID=A0A2P5FLH7_TREOI|nr:Major facilitator superfamily domain containing protein [Trema orientale]